MAFKKTDSPLGINQGALEPIIAPIPHIPAVRAEDQPITMCWIDAATSTRMVAVVIEDERVFQVFRVRPDWRSDGRDINWMEAIGFELLAGLLIARGYTGRVLVSSDSEAALNVFSGRVDSKPLKEVASRLKVGSRNWPFTMRARWVSGKINKADPYSRGKVGPGYNKLKCSIQIPKALKVFVPCDE